MQALGIDVGGVRKGLDLVLLNEHRRVVYLKTRVSVDSLSTAVESLQPDIVAIDSPARWAPPGRRRETERALTQVGMTLYSTPSEERMSARGFHDWMQVGMEAFRAIEHDVPLFSGETFVGRCIEVFPHASAVVLAGSQRPANVGKVAWRRQILIGEGVNDHGLSSPDLVDAALAAVTGLYALEGKACWMGRPEEGVIVLPCEQSRLKDFRVPGLVSTATPATHSVRCSRCDAGNPTGSKFCNQCGTPLVEVAAGVRAAPARLYPDRKTRELTRAEKAEIRRRIDQGDQDSFGLAREYGCAVVQIAGIRAAATLAGRTAVPARSLAGPAC